MGTDVDERREDDPLAAMGATRAQHDSPVKWSATKQRQGRHDGVSSSRRLQVRRPLCDESRGWQHGTSERDILFVKCGDVEHDDSLFQLCKAKSTGSSQFDAMDEHTSLGSVPPTE